MPYITQERRDDLAEDGGDPVPQTAGELNYCITQLIRTYMYRKGINYGVLNDILGALEGAKLEFYRRIVTPYENQKQQQNGDVYS